MNDTLLRMSGSFSGRLAGGRLVGDARHEAQQRHHGLSNFVKYMVYFSHAGIRTKRVLRRNWFLRDKPSGIAEVQNYARSMASPFSLQKFELDTANLPHFAF